MGVTMDSNEAGNACSSSETETINGGRTANCAQETETKAETRVRKRPKIAVLPQAVVDQIAAGEVVQRPVSVVKELVENSLDAGATQIVVQFDGLSKLSVVDNGKGISKSDLGLLCTRHATSKLQSVDDFDDLSTFGFRGEALASASMVSRLLTVVSRVRFGDYEDDHEEKQQQPSHSNAMAVAYSQSYKNGAPLQPLPKPCARKVGTTITIEDLFYNVPHRQKAYSKKESEEYGKIHALIQDYSVHYPTVGFVCQRKTRTKRSKQHPQLIVDCNTGQIPAVKALLQSRDKARQSNQQNPQQQHEKIQHATKQILSHVLESNLANHLLYMECSAPNANETSPAKEAMESNAEEHSPSNAENIRNSSSHDQPSSSRYEFQYSAEIYFTSPTYHSTPGKGGKTKQGKFILFLNHRLVDLPPLKRALEDVYADLGNPNRNKGSSNNNNTNLGKPVLVVNLSVPGCQVDVNVHPSKRQVALMHQEDLIRDVSSKLKDRLEEDGQAFVAQSVKTIVRNPYAKTASNSKKRKRPEDCGNDSMEEDEEEYCCSDKDDKEEIDTGPSKRPSRRASRTKTDTEDEQSSNASKANTPSSKSSNSSSNHTNKTNPKKVAPSKLIRTNSAARAGAIEPFLVSTQISQSQSQSQQTLSQSTQASAASDSTTEPPSPRSDLQQQLSQQQLSVFHVPSCPLANPSSSRPALDMTKPGAFAEQLKREICTCPTEPARRTVLVPKTIVRPKKVTPTPSKYMSIASLRNRVMKQQCFETTALIRKAFFMGTMSHQRSLVQCDEELVMINHFEMAKELFYQLALARFGGGAHVAQLGSFGGNGGIHIQTVVAQALQCEDELIQQHEKEREQFKSGSNDNSNNNDNNNNNIDGLDSGMSLTGMLEVNDSNCNLAQHVTARLVESAPMLDEYFSIRIENQNQDENDHGVDNRSIDDISKGAILTGLPILLDGHCPQPHALPIFLLRLATQVDWTREKHCFHGVCKELGNFYAMLPHDSNGNGELNSYVQHQLFPALSYIMLPSKNLTKNGHCTKMTKLSTLYKVFERC